MSKRIRVSTCTARLQELGISPAAVLARAGLPVTLFDSPRVLVDTAQFFAIWSAIAELTTDPAIGIALAAETRPEHFHPIAIAAIATDDCHSAITHIARFKQLTCPEEIHHHHTPSGEWHVSIRWTMATVPEPPILTDFCFAWLLNVLRHGTGTSISPLRVELTHPRSYLRTLQRHFNCPVTAGAAQNTLVFRTSDAHIPFLTRNRELFDILATQFNRDLAEQAGQPEQLERHEAPPPASFPEQVRRSIEQRLSGQRPSIEDIARLHYVSSRTLQRRLREAGSSFQSVLEQARRHMARYYLTHSLLEVNEAAYLLGYEDANSFARAFRSWEGMPPATWRQSQRSTAIQN